MLFKLKSVLYPPDATAINRRRKISRFFLAAAAYEHCVTIKHFGWQDWEELILNRFSLLFPGVWVSGSLFSGSESSWSEFSWYRNADPENLESWRAFLKRPENFSGPKTFRGSFQVNFSGPGKRFSTRPKTPRILTRVFRVVFSGLQRELDSDLLRT